MTRACFLQIALLLLVGFGLAWAQIPPAAPALICPRVAISPTIDGRLDDWPALPQAVIASADDWHPADPQFAHYGGPQDISAEIRFAWDNRALHIAIDVRDDTLVRVRSASQIDRGDSVVLSLAQEGAAEANELVVALLRGSSLVWRSQPVSATGESKTVARAIWARQEEEGGWRVTYELAFPWSELAPLRPIPGQEFTLSISLCDDDGAGIKGCLERSLPVVFAADAAGRAAPARPAALKPRFPKPELARYDRRAFAFSDKPALLFGGLVDYAHLPRESWPEQIAVLRAAGMNTVSVTVPWSHHQRQAGQFDFADLKELLDLCRQAGFWVVLGLGPYAGDDWEAGGVPGWLVGPAPVEGLPGAVNGWYRALLPIVKQYQLSAGGPVAAVMLRPLPDAAGRVETGGLQALMELARGGGTEVPLLTANALPARDNTKQSLANMLDTLAFYGETTLADLLPRLRALANEENGPAVISALPGRYADSRTARQSAAAIKAALGLGATAILLSDAAPRLTPNTAPGPGLQAEASLVDLAGGRSPGYGELRLIGAFLREFGPELARAVAAEGVVRADDPAVQVAARLGEKAGFIFLWDERGGAAHQVRLSYTQPGTAATITIPEAGAISLAPGCAKMLALDVPVGRGLLRYATSEIAGLHQLGERTLLVVYGDVDTPGEIALRWPGPPLVSGEVTRQRWDPERNLLILDYFHTQQDRYLLVDDLEIAILSRERAAAASEIAGDSGAITLSAGAAVASGSASAAGIEAALDCPEGALQVSAALPRPPSAVMLDGEPIEYNFTTPSRVLTLAVTTQSFEEEDRPSALGRLGRAILGGPPRLSASFDRAWFLPDSAAPDGDCRSSPALGLAPEALGLTTGSFARLRASFEGADAGRLRVTGSIDPALAFINGRPVLELSGTGLQREADLAPLVAAGSNQVEILLDLSPRADGFAGLWETKRLPEVTLVGSQGMAPLGNWEVCPGLAGEAAGWPRLDLDVSRWHLLRLGPWRAQERELARVWGVGWYRFPFGLPRPEAWHIPYYLNFSLRGNAALYLNGNRIATCRGDGAFRVPLPAPLVQQGGENLIAAAVYGLGPETGLEQVEIAADRGQMTRRRTLTIRF